MVRTIYDIFQIHFIQESYYKVIVQVVKDVSSEKTFDKLEEMLKTQLDTIFPKGTEVVFNWMDYIPADGNGKKRKMETRVMNLKGHRDEKSRTENVC